MLDKIFNALKSYNNKINEVEYQFYKEKKNFVEIYERNRFLESEIEHRTNELNQANRSILALSNILDTMNSSEPLSEIVRKIVDRLSADMGYVYAMLFQIVEEDDDSFLKVRAVSEGEYSANISSILKKPVELLKIKSNESNIVSKIVQNQDFDFINNFEAVFESSNMELDEGQKEKLRAVFYPKCISLLPIKTQDSKFGAVLVVSQRKEITETEQNFLKLFTNQVDLAITIAGLFETIRNQAVTDPMTGLYNRRYFSSYIVQEVERSSRLKQPFSLITLDLDHLKQINDTFGHSIGDEAICTIAHVLKKNARNIDISVRFGGEEFGILLPGIDSKGAMVAAERLRVAIEKESVKEVGHVTASIGVATFLEHTDNIDELMEIVDQAMYRAKKNGRNRVVLASVEQKESWTEIAFDTLREILLSPDGELSSRIEPDIKKELEKFFDTNPKELTEKLFQLSDDIIKRYDPMHSEKNSIKEKIHLASKLAKEAKLDEEEIDKIKLSIILYDLGNLFVPEEILLKPGPLNRKEAYQISQHPTIAVKQILKPVEKIQNIFPIVEHHHENWDGSGYPGQLSGEKIPIGSRIIFIVDAYCALISDRPYRRAYSQEEALKILEEGANSKWDGNLVKLFISIIKQ